MESSTMKKEVIQAIKEDKLYGFISQHYFEMEPSTLATIIKEMSFSIYHLTSCTGMLFASTQELNNDIIENLTEQWEDELEEDEEDE